MAGVEVLGEVDEEGYVGGVVEGAVVEGVFRICRDGGAVAVAVEVGGEDDGLRGEGGVGAGEEGEDVRARSRLCG